MLDYIIINSYTITEKNMPDNNLPASESSSALERYPKKYPLFANALDNWDENTMDGWQWSKLLSEQPQFSNRCDWRKLTGRDWSSLLSCQPQFADFCDWYKLNYPAWQQLLEHQVQFTDIFKEYN